jgi:hypothetical protein
LKVLVFEATKKPDAIRDIGFLMIPQKCRRVSQTQGVRGPNVRRLCGETAVTIAF